jgi:hypothetical protein
VPRSESWPQSQPRGWMMLTSAICSSVAPLVSMMSGEPSARLSGDEILALKFAVHRQLSRYRAATPLAGCRAPRQRIGLEHARRRSCHPARRLRPRREPRQHRGGGSVSIERLERRDVGADPRPRCKRSLSRPVSPT